MSVTFTDPKDAQRWREVCRLLDDRPNIFARRGSVVATYRRYRGRRLGPYYALIFREEGHRRDPQRTVYLGGNAELADAVRRVLTKTQAPRDLIRDERRAQRRRIAQTEAQLRTIDQTLAAVAKTLARAEQKCSHRRQTAGEASHAETQLPHALASVATDRAEQTWSATTRRRFPPPTPSELTAATLPRPNNSEPAPRAEQNGPPPEVAKRAEQNVPFPTPPATATSARPVPTVLENQSDDKSSHSKRRAEQKCSHRRQTVGEADSAETQLPHALASVATERAEQNPDSRFPTPESPPRAEQNPNPPIRQKFNEVLNKNRSRRWEAQRLRSEFAAQMVRTQAPSRPEVGQRPPC